MSESRSLADLIAAVPPGGLAELIAPRVAVDPDDWHEPLPTPVAEAPAVEDAKEEDDNGCCPDCGGYLECRCFEPEDRWDDDDGAEEEDWDDEETPSMWSNAEPLPPNPRRMCPCCGGRNDPAELFFPYCSNDCSKTH